MFWYFNKRIRKGYSLASSLVIGMFCISLVLIGLKFNIEIYKYNAYFKEYKTKNNYKEECRENLFSSLWENMNGNIPVLDTCSVKSYYSGIINFKLIYKNSYLKYNSSKDAFVMYTYVDSYFHLEDYYTYKIENGRLNIALYKTISSEGGI